MSLKRIVLMAVVLVSVLSVTAITVPAHAADLFSQTCAPTVIDSTGKEIPNPALTSDVCQSRGDTTKDPITGSNGLLTKGISLLTYIAALIATVVVVIGGIMYVTSNGDSSKAATARQMIIYAMIGLIVIILARSVVLLIVNRV